MVSVIAHRGASEAARENTIAAFALAVAAGADGVELDVRRSADGALVVHHDAEIEGLGLIRDLRAADLPGWVPLLDAAIEACSDLQVNIEIKNLPTEPDFDPTEALAAQVAAFVTANGLVDRVIVSSFNLNAIDRVKAAEPAVATGYLTLPIWDQLACLEQVRAGGHQALHPQHLAVNGELCRTAHDRGVAVNTWTVDDPERMVWLVEAGVDAIITNRPEVGVAAVRPAP